MKKIFFYTMTGIFLVTGLLWTQVFAGGEEDKGKSLYKQKCQMCHGKNGDGKGSAATFLNVPPADFTDPSFWKDHDNKEISESIENGKGEMPGFNLKPDELKAIIDYISHAFKK